MHRWMIFVLVGLPTLFFGQTNKSKYKAGSANQFTLFDVQFTYTKADADSSKPSKSHFYF